MEAVLLDVTLLLFLVLIITFLVAIMLTIIGIVTLVAKQWWREVRDA